VSKASSEAPETYKIEFEDIRLFSGADGGSHLIGLGRPRAPGRHDDHARPVGLLPAGHVDGDHGRVGRGQDDDHELARARVLEPRAKSTGDEERRKQAPSSDFKNREATRASGITMLQHF
jgi:hypothetical protein